MRDKLLDERGLEGFPILVDRMHTRLRRSSPLRLRRLAWCVRRTPARARQLGIFLIRPEGGSNILGNR